MSENPLVESFAVAEEKLLQAIDRQRSKGTNGEENRDSIVDDNGVAATTAVPKGESVNFPTADYETDPDDMAAAFFAMQAKKKKDEERQNEKIFEDWATIVLRKQERKQIESANSKPTKELAIRSSVSLAEELLLECQTILRS